MLFLCRISWETGGKGNTQIPQERWVNGLLLVTRRDQETTVPPTVSLAIGEPYIREIPPQGQARTDRRGHEPVLACPWLGFPAGFTPVGGRKFRTNPHTSAQSNVPN